MCGRYTLTASDSALIQAFELEDVSGYKARYNIAPTQSVPIITSAAPKRLTWMRWGLIPSWAKDPSIGSTLINARSETLDEKPSFKESFKRRRCLVPADGFYEWRKDGTSKKPQFIFLENRRLFAFAGLWDAWKNPQGEWVQSCTIITTEPNDVLRPLHHRMAVILNPDKYAPWLDPEMPTEALKPFFKPYPNDGLSLYEVSPLVNGTTADSPDLIVPYTSPQQRGLF